MESKDTAAAAHGPPTWKNATLVEKETELETGGIWPHRWVLFLPMSAAWQPGPVSLLAGDLDDERVQI